jgi:hypothetical protein
VEQKARKMMEIHLGKGVKKIGGEKHEFGERNFLCAAKDNINSSFALNVKSLVYFKGQRLSQKV